MSRILITGSTQGIGAETARQLIALGNEVVIHARNADRASVASGAVPGAAAVLTGELDSLASTTALAHAAAEHGPYDVIIHNAGLGGGQESRVETVDGLERIFQTNVVAPYVLSCLLPIPPRLVFLTSGLEANGRWTPDDLQWTSRAWRGMRAYSDSKLHDSMLAFELAARYPDSVVNCVDPGWIKTNMGGPEAPDPVELGAETQVWLASSDDSVATTSGHYLKRREVQTPNPVTQDAAARGQLVAELERITGLTLP